MINALTFGVHLFQQKCLTFEVLRNFVTNCNSNKFDLKLNLI